MKCFNVVVLNAIAFLCLWLIGRFLPVPLLLRGMIFFLGAVFLVMTQMLAFFWRRVVNRLQGRWRSIVGKLFVVFALLSLAAPMLQKFLPGSVFTELSLACYLSNVWLLFLCIGFSLARRIIGSGKWTPHTESVWIILGMLLFAGAATHEARSEYEVNHVTVRLGLPKPLSIAMLSDLHLGPVLVCPFFCRCGISAHMIIHLKEKGFLRSSLCNGQEFGL